MWVGGGIWSCAGNDWGVYGKGEESCKHEIVGVVEWALGTYYTLGTVESRESGLLGVCAVSDKRATVSGKGG